MRVIIDQQFSLYGKKMQTINRDYCSYLALMCPLPLFQVDVGALRKCRCHPFQCCCHGERRYTVKQSRLQPGIRQDPGGLCICLDSSRINRSKDCLRDVPIWNHPNSCWYTEGTVWKVTHTIHKHTADCMRAPMHMNLPPLLSSACGLTLLSECKPVWKHDLGNRWWIKDRFKWCCLFLPRHALEMCVSVKLLLKWKVVD